MSFNVRTKKIYRYLRVNVSKYQNSRSRRQVVDFFMPFLNKPYGKLFSKNASKGSAALWFCQNRGNFENAILAVDRGRGHRYLTEIDAFSLRSYRKTRSNLHICFGHVISHRSTFLKLDIDIVSKNL